MPGKILIVDDDPAMCELLDEGLGRRGFETTSRTSADEALRAIGGEEFDVVVTDLNMRAMNGLELCERIVSNRRDLPVVVITAFGSLESAIGAIRAGAYDFITKPFELDAVALALERAIRHHRLSEEVKRLRRAVARVRGFDELLGENRVMQQLFDLLDRAAETDSTVLISGESGTGKELAARAIHRRSRRSGGPFVAVNCSAVPPLLLESELFGHVPGAFTDARNSRAGLFQKSDGGTLFLDEIGDLEIGLQPKLLRALQERLVRPVGADREVAFDARIVAATNRDLEAAVEEGRFREDLWFRINVINIELPPLRSRGSDILLLAQHFVRTLSERLGRSVHGISSGAAEKLMAYGWPGNVRELQNSIERGVALTRFEELTVEDLPEKIRNYRPSHVLVAGEDPAELLPLYQVERRYVLRVLEAVGGNKTLAARILGMDRKTLYRKLEGYGGVKEPSSR
jgi:two-component system response regulator AtoC